MSRRKLGPSALRVYLELVKARRPLGVRELQRRLGFKSPSTVKFHLDKLVEQGYVKHVEEGYIAVHREGVTSLFLVVKGYMIPRILPLAIFLITYPVLYMILGGETGEGIYQTLVLMEAVGIILVAEALRLKNMLE